MRLGMLLFAGLVGCSFAYHADEEARPEAGAIDAHGDARHGDGPPDAAAFVPVPYFGSATADLDQDGYTNDVDPCPTLSIHDFPSSNVDTDGDGVGDLCDPHPGEAIDCVVLVDDFSDLPLTRWDPIGTWHAGPDCPRTNGPGYCGGDNAGGLASLRFDRPLAADVVVVDASLGGHTDTTTTAFEVGTGLAGQSQLSGPACGVVRDGNTPALDVVILRDDIAQPALAPIDVSTALDTNARTQTTWALGHACTVGNTTLQSPTLPDATGSDASVAIRGDHIEMSLHSVVAYSQHCAPRHTGSGSGGE